MIGRVGFRERIEQFFKNIEKAGMLIEIASKEFVSFDESRLHYLSR